MKVDISCQKFDIPGTTIERDHTGEQVNKIIKNGGGITGITRNENSRIRHFFATPTLSSISKEMLGIGRANISKHLRNITSYLCPTVRVKMKTYLH